MKKNYVMPQMKVVKINQRMNIMDAVSNGVNSVYSGDTGIGYGGAGRGEGRSRDYDDWDE